jgi:hypothetical protein
MTTQRDPLFDRRVFATASQSYDDVTTAREHHNSELVRAACYNDLFIASQAYAGCLQPIVRTDMDVEHLLWEKQHMDQIIGGDWYQDSVKLALGV